MKDTTDLHVEAQNAIELFRQEQKSLIGPVVPRYLAAAMPHFGERRSSMDQLALLVLCEIISAHRPNKAGNVFWKSALFQVNLIELARQSGARYKDVSRVLRFLEQHELIRLNHRGRKNEGVWGGSRVYAIPRIDRIVQRINDAKLQADLDQVEFPDDTKNQPLELPLSGMPELDDYPVTDNSMALNEEFKTHSVASQSALSANPIVGHEESSLKSLLRDVIDGAGGADGRHALHALSACKVVVASGPGGDGGAPINKGPAPETSAATGQRAPGNTLSDRRPPSATTPVPPAGATDSDQAHPLTPGIYPLDATPPTRDAAASTPNVPPPPPPPPGMPPRPVGPPLPPSPRLPTGMPPRPVTPSAASGQSPISNEAHSHACDWDSFRPTPLPPGSPPRTSSKQTVSSRISRAALRTGPMIDPQLPDGEKMLTIRADRFARMFAEAYIRRHKGDPSPLTVVHLI